MPQHLTPLRHTAAYGRFSETQKLRYNQLHALYFNEQIIFFESAMAQHILRSFIPRHPPARLADGLQKFLSEEAGHSKMFRELNRLCLPGIYNHSDFHFIHVPAISGSCLRWWADQSFRFPFFLWILLIQEERALFYAKEFLKNAPTLEAAFVAAQKKHLADEVGHVQWDEELLDWIWPQTSPGWRQVNARLFAWMMGEYFTTPKRSGLRVVAALVREFPDLQPLWPEIKSQMISLDRNPEFNALCYSREVTPKTFARFDRWPEFRRLERVLSGYRPQ